jgi:hypothetical protein
MMGDVASTVDYHDVANKSRGVGVLNVDVGRTVWMHSASPASQYLFSFVRQNSNVPSFVARTSTYFRKVTSRLAGDALAPASTASIVRAVENSMIVVGSILLSEILYM